MSAIGQSRVASGARALREGKELHREQHPVRRAHGDVAVVEVMAGLCTTHGVPVSADADQHVAAETRSSMKAKSSMPVSGAVALQSIAGLSIATWPNG